MKALKGTLLFVLGMIVGIILFVVAIGGAAYAIATMTTVNQLQNTIGVDIVDKDSDIADMSLFEVVKDIISDVQNLDSLTLQTLIDKYGLPIPSEISGVDISSVFKYPILKVGDHVTEIVNSVTLDQILEIAGTDVSSFNLPPIVTDNLSNNVQTALNNILGSIDAQKMTLRQIETNFGLNLGANGILDMLKDAPFASIANTVMTLTVGELTQIDSDKFVKAGEVPVYVKNASPYVLVNAADYGKIEEGAKTYVYGSSDGKTVYKELRFVQKTVNNEDGTTKTEYVVDNSSNEADFAADEENPVNYYRYVEYVPYDVSVSYPADTEFFVPVYLNSFAENTAEDGSVYYSEKQAGHISLKTLFSDASGSNSLNASVSNASVNVPEILYFAKSEEDGSITVSSADVYGINPEILLSASSKLDKGYKGYAKIYVGSAATAMQALSGLKLNDLSTATDEIMNLKIKDVFDVTSNSSALLQSMADKTLRELTDSFDDITIADIMDVSQSAFVENADGIYAYVSVLADYVPADGSVSGEPLYYLKYVENAKGSYVKYGDAFYKYDSSDKRFENCVRFNKEYTADPTASTDSSKAYLRTDKGGYYTLYNPDAHKNSKRYSIADANYSIASESEIENAENLFFWNNGTMSVYTGSVGDQNRLFVRKAPSANIIQRLAYTPITGFSDAVNSLVLGDVTEIMTDIYSQAGMVNDTGALTFTPVEGADYFYFDRGIYKSFDPSDTTLLDTLKGQNVYTLKISGSGNTIMKKLALLSVKDFGSRMDEVMDNLCLGDVIDITADAYVKDDAGAYAHISKGDYFTLYNPALHSGAQRYSKYVSPDGTRFALASSSQIAAGNDLYYYDYGSKEMKTYTSSVSGAGFLYAVLPNGESVSSSVLQRFKKSSLGAFSSAFDSLTLSDVLNFDADVYAKTALIDENGSLKTADGNNFVPSAETDYYWYDDGLYRIADLSGDSDFAATHKKTEIFILAYAGKGNAIIKKLAYVNINDLGAKMNDVINETYLSELIAINENSAVKEDVGGSSYLVAPDLYSSVKNATLSTSQFAFVFDNNGDYMRAPSIYMPATSQQLIANGTGTYKYAKAINTQNNQTIIQSLVEIDYASLYFKSTEGTYIRNAAAVALLAVNGYYDDIYKRVNADDTSGITGTEASYSKYAASVKLFVNTLGDSFVKYDPDNPAHADMPLYWLYDNGKYPVSAVYVKNGEEYKRYDAATDSGKEKFLQSGESYFSLSALAGNVIDNEKVYYYNHSSSSYTEAKPIGGSEQQYVSLKADSAGNYYYAAYVKPADGTKIARYSRRGCETVYSENANGTYVFINNKYTPYSDSVAEHAGLIRYNAVTGYIAATDEVTDGSARINSDFVKISVIRSKSEAPLRAFARYKTTVANLNDVIGSLRISDLMETQYDGIFADDNIKNATLNNVGTVFTDKIKNMSFGEIIDISEAAVNTNVRTLIGDVSLNDFIGSLKYDASAANPIYIDLYSMLKIDHSDTKYSLPTPSI